MRDMKSKIDIFMYNFTNFKKRIVPLYGLVSLLER